MQPALRQKKIICFLVAFLIMPLSLSACASFTGDIYDSVQEEQGELDISRFLSAVTDEPDTVDFQRTTIHYDVALNVFNRLVETENGHDGNLVIRPSLAESWEMSEDGREYTFHLRDKVKFSDGSPLTSSDVLYTFKRLLTFPDGCNRDIARPIAGADRLESGETDELSGFRILSDRDFVITLEEPFEAFLPCLSMPGASIMDEESASAAGELFGMDPEHTIGTGSFILKTWVPSEGMVLVANPDCFEGPPKCDGLNLHFMTEPEEIVQMFENGGLDILNLDKVGNDMEYYIHGDIYQDRLYAVPQICIVYIALNESVEPLDDVRVRKALQISLDRQALLDAVYSGRGAVENGIYPHGLYGFNPDLPEIPYDPEEAKELLAEAGYPDGFEMTAAINASSTQWEWNLLKLAAVMWEKIGVHASIEVMDEGRFMSFRKNGGLSCYTAMWTADYDDPDNFISTFYGSWENTMYRSLCYPDEQVMERVRKARSIVDPDARIEEYRDLERKVAQEDAAWVPLFSRVRYYVASERLSGITSSWNGSLVTKYREFSIKETE